jgi:hypothetical protein
MIIDFFINFILIYEYNIHIEIEIINDIIFFSSNELILKY